MTREAGPEATLVLVCRRPAPGSGKQRLARELGAEQALAIGQLLLAAALEDAEDWPGPVILAPADGSDVSWAAALLARPATVMAQGEGNLGERLAGLDEAARRQGHGALIYIGSDAPVLDGADYAAARSRLRALDVVLQPALDGGVTLMGARKPWPTLADLPWSSAQLHDALRARCQSAGLAVGTLPTRYDIDVPADLARLAPHLATDPRPGRQALFRKLVGLGYAQSRTDGQDPP
jgi:uncharacterized protein